MLSSALRSMSPSLANPLANEWAALNAAARKPAPRVPAYLMSAAEKATKTAKVPA